MRHPLQSWMCLWSIVFSIGQGGKVQRLYVPEGHFLFLPCSNQSNVEWRLGVTKVIATQNGSKASYHNQYKHSLLPNGMLLIRDLKESDSEKYFCNNQLVAHLGVLRGDEYTLPAGSTLVLPCKMSDSQAKQTWAFKGRKKKKYISTRYKNGTTTRQREDPDRRFLHGFSDLLIRDLQPQDSGLYLCNGRETASLWVTAAEQDIPATTVIMDINSEDEETEISSQTPAYVIGGAVAGLCALTLLTALVVSMVINMKNKRRKRKGRKERTGNGQEVTRLQLQLMACTDPPRHRAVEEPSFPVLEHHEVEYASLGRQNWRERNRAPHQSSANHHVIYSTLAMGSAHQPS